MPVIKENDAADYLSVASALVARNMPSCEMNLVGDCANQNALAASPWYFGIARYSKELPVWVGSGCFEIANEPHQYHPPSARDPTGPRFLPAEDRTTGFRCIRAQAVGHVVAAAD